jgi:FkbM family methyltransferase
VAYQNSVIDALENRINHKIGGATSRGLVMTNTKNGVFIGKPGDLISDSILKGESWDSHILDLARQVALRRNGLAVDVGAHLGSSTLAFASVFDQVISFEPNDFNFRVLRANVQLNSLENVRVFNHGLFSRETILSLAESSKQEIPIPLDGNGELNGDHSSNLGAYYFEEGASRLFEHPAITLDSLELDNVVFIKIDTQGADGEILMGAIQTIRRCQPIVVFEWEEQLAMNFTITFRNIQKEFETLGYQLSELKKHNEKQIDYVASPLISINHGL